jgi:hypothetical protein
MAQEFLPYDGRNFIMSMKATKPPAEKMGIKESSRGILINAPEDTVQFFICPN